MCDCEKAKRAEIEAENALIKRESEARKYRQAFPRRDLGSLNSITLNDFEARPGSEMPLKATKRYIRMLPNPDPSSLFIWGGQGNGKSHMAAAIVTAADLLTMSVAWVHTPTWLRMVGSLNDDPGRRESQIALAAEAELLVLDDLGAENLTAARAEYLLSILDARYRKRAPTVITTNRSLDELPTALTPKDELANGYEVKAGARITDRLLEMSLVVENKARSYREELAARRLEALAQELAGEE